IKPVDLPVEAWYPGFKPWVQQEEISRLNAGIAAAEAPCGERKKNVEVAQRASEDLQKDAANAVADPDGFRNSTKPAALLAAETNYRAAQLSYRIGEINLRYAWALLRSLESRVAADKARFGNSTPT